MTRVYDCISLHPTSPAASILFAASIPMPLTVRDRRPSLCLFFPSSCSCLVLLLLLDPLSCCCLVLSCCCCCCLVLLLLLSQHVLFQAEAFKVVSRHHNMIAFAVDLGLLTKALHSESRDTHTHAAAAAAPLGPLP